MKSLLVLVRHGTSVWNKEGKWTGWTDVDLAPEGVAEAQALGKVLSDIDFAHAHTSALKRAQQTLTHLLDSHGKATPTTSIHPALNERHYGIHTGKNKWNVKKELGEEEFTNIRRGWDYAVPEGESLKQVFERVVPYFESTIKPQLEQGNTIISAHGNSLRALVKHLEGITDAAICDVEIGHGEAHCYLIENGKIINKQIRTI